MGYRRIARSSPRGARGARQQWFELNFSATSAGVSAYSAGAQAFLLSKPIGKP